MTLINEVPVKVKYPAIEKFVTAGELTVGYKTTKPEMLVILKKSDVVSNYIRKLYDEDRIEYCESFFCIFLGRDLKVRGWAKISEGGMSGTVVDVRMIMHLVINSAAHNIIISHNHPSGQLKPSEQDNKLTEKIKHACAYFDINLLDHVIVSKEGHFSYADEGLL